MRGPALGQDGSFPASCLCHRARGCPVLSLHHTHPTALSTGVDSAPWTCLVTAQGLEATPSGSLSRAFAISWNRAQVGKATVRGSRHFLRASALLLPPPLGSLWPLLVPPPHWALDPPPTSRAEPSWHLPPSLYLSLGVPSLFSLVKVQKDKGSIRSLGWLTGQVRGKGLEGAGPEGALVITPTKGQSLDVPGFSRDGGRQSKDVPGPRRGSDRFWQTPPGAGQA